MCAIGMTLVMEPPRLSIEPRQYARITTSNTTVRYQPPTGDPILSLQKGPVNRCDYVAVQRDKRFRALRDNP